MTKQERRAELRHRVNGTTAALLVRAKTSNPVLCDSIDVSQGGMGISTRETLAQGERLLLRLDGQEIALTVVWTKRISSTGALRCGLSVDDPNASVEGMFFHLPTSDASDFHPRRSLSAQRRLNDQEVRALRIPVPDNLIIGAKTFGNPSEYALNAQNVSRSGLLLVAPSKECPPFRSGTLLELAIDTNVKWATKTIRCMGKVVRVIELKASGETSFGIHITEMDAPDLLVWDACILRLLEAADGG